jgi:hypothetical protein
VPVLTERIPGEFRYWERVDDRAVQRARKMWQTVCRFDPQPSDDYVRRFARAYYDTDPVAEAFVADVYDILGAKRGRELLDQALEHGVESVPDAPESMRRLFAEFETSPSWLDQALLERGARVFRRWGTAVFKFATASTLEMYTGSWKPSDSGSTCPIPAVSTPAARVGQPRCAYGSCTSSSAGGCSSTRSGISTRGARRSASRTQRSP